MKKQVSSTHISSPNKRQQSAVLTSGFKSSAVITALSLALASQAFAASFVIEDGEINNVTKTLEDDETGVIKKGGELSVTGASSGVSVIGGNARITNSGSINSEDNYGINSNGIGAIITNSGSIKSTGGGGINSSAVGSIITNSGEIDSYDNGIDSDGDATVITNSGNIDGDYGIYIGGADNRVTHSGVIKADNVGIQTSGARSVINISGTINSNEYGVYAHSESSYSKIIISGTINDDYGIVSLGNNTHIINSGIINSAQGIDTYSANDVKINNSGEILATSEGISSSGDNAIITNSGTITGPLGISATGVNNIVNNSGFINGNAGIAVEGDGANYSTLNLLPGSRVLGSIDLGGSDGGVGDVANIYAGSVSATLKFVNTETINLMAPGVKLNNVVVSVDGTAEAARSVTLSSVTSSIHHLIGQRMAQPSKPASARVAASTESSAIAFEQHKPLFWGQIFGSSLDREAEGNARAYEHAHAGINFGYEWAYSEARFGLVGGLVNSDTDSKTESFSTDEDQYYVGAYANHKVRHFNITTSFLAGYGSHNNKRLVIDNLNGYEWAKSDFDSVFVSPSLLIASAYKVSDKFELRPAASVSYSMAWLDDYAESGTSQSDLSVDKRKIRALSSQIQVALAYAYAVDNEFELRAGLNSRHSDDDDTKISIGATQSKFSNVGDETVSGSFVGARLRASNSERLALVADIELGGGNEEDYARANLSLEFIF